MRSEAGKQDEERGKEKRGGWTDERLDERRRIETSARRFFQGDSCNIL